MQIKPEKWFGGRNLTVGAHLDAPIQQTCSNLIQILPGLLRPASYYQACSGLMQPLKNQEAPGPMKVFGGGLPPTFALQEASAFNFQTSAIEKKP